MTLGSRISYYRKKLGWTLEELSTRADGVEVGTINALENRGSKRSVFALPIAKAFGLTLEQLQDETRDWLDPNAGPPASLTAHSTDRPGYVRTAWPFSAELYERVQRLKPPALVHAENLLRAHFQMAALPPDAKPPGAADPPKIVHLPEDRNIGGLRQTAGQKAARHKHHSKGKRA